MHRIATKTLAEIYLKQGHLQEAYEIYKALAEKDPFDLDIQRRMEELGEQLNPSPSADFTYPLSSEEKMRYLKNWLANIRKRRQN